MCFFMIRKCYPKYEILESKNPKQLTDKLNSLLEGVAKKDVEVKTGFDSSIGHYAHVKWMEDLTIPEDIRDEFALKGIKYVCGQCPFFVLHKDKRIKYHICNKGEHTWYEHSACNMLYEMIEKGEIEL